ncbi:hypothetical protein N8511_03620, partial [Akkermansiaceae bacterium]|nr:hypothetical protein [Akkermansiaceae bacterium]
GKARAKLILPANPTRATMQGLLAGSPKKRLEMGRSRFAIYHHSFRVLEACYRDHFYQFHFGKAQPGIEVKFARLFKSMLEKVENDEPPRPA